MLVGYNCVSVFKLFKHSLIVIIIKCKVSYKKVGGWVAKIFYLAKAQIYLHYSFPLCYEQGDSDDNL